MQARHRVFISAVFHLVADVWRASRKKLMYCKRRTYNGALDGTYSFCLCCRRDFATEGRIKTKLEGDIKDGSTRVVRILSRVIHLD